MASSGGSRVRLTVWMSGTEFRVLDAAAEGVGVETGALARVAALRSAGLVARDVSEGRVRLRRRSVAVPVQVPAASASEEVPGAFGRREGAEGAVQRGPARGPASPRELADRTAMFRAATEGRRS